MNVSNFCEISGVLRTFYFIKLFINITLIVLPIIIIITTSINFFKVVIDGKNDTLKDVSITTVKKLIAALIVFFIPSILNYCFTILVDTGVSFAACWTNASLESVKDAELLEEERRKEERKQYEKELAESIAEREALDKARNEVIKQHIDKYNSGGDLEGEVLTSGKTGIYFAPIQDGSGGGSSASLTGGCANETPVYHDKGVKVGTPVYAPYDGTAKYIQSNCNGYISSYGNQVRVYKEDGTYIIYAHFSKFPESIEMPLTKDCKDSNSPTKCGAGHCSVGMTSTTVAEVTVKKGQIIGYTGNSGNSEGPHLHVEIHEGGSSTCITDPWAAFGMR